MRLPFPSLAPAPRTLAFRAEPLWIGDAAAGRRLLSGTFRFAGREARADPEAGPWRVAPPSAAFADALHGFEWLDDLAALDTRAARRAARDWTYGWIARWGDARGPHRAPGVAGRRLAAWTGHAALLCDPDDPSLERRLAGAIRAEARRLRRPGLPARPTAEVPDPQLARLSAAVGLLTAELALGPESRAARRAAVALDAAVPEPFALASRAPEALLEALIVLELAARRMVAAGRPVSRPLGEAVRAAQADLRALRLRDGGLPRFHGGAAGRPERIDRALALARRRDASGPRRDRPLGFVRLTAGRATAAIDAAPPPPGPDAHASTLAFEFAFGARRLIINCGPGREIGGEWRDACRATAAQSTLSLAGVSSSRFGRGPDAGARAFRAGPREVTAETATDVEGSWFLGSHDGYRETHGFVHRRRLFLSPDGRDFRGEDVLAPAEGARRPADAAAFQIHFHLTPDVAAAAREESGGVVLDLPEGAWRFTCRGARLELDDSVRLEPGRDAPEASRRIRLTGTTAGGAARVAWALARDDG